MENKQINEIIECLKTVYDPEFPMVDLYTLGLIYDINFDNKTNEVKIKMTYTTIACPLWDMLQQLCKNAILDKYPDYSINIELTFEPLWTPNMIKDEDIKKIFNN